MLEEKLKTNTTNEIMFGVGLTLGGAIFGLAPYFWDKGNNDHLAGGICIAVAVVLTAGAIAGRLFYGSRT